MLKAMVYPYDIESVYIARYSQLITDLHINKLIAPNGWGLTGKDASYVDMGRSPNIKVDIDFCKALAEIDVVIFVNSYNELDFAAHIYPKIIYCIENKKDVICYIKLKKDLVNQLLDLSRLNGVIFLYNEEYEEKKLTEKEHRLLKVSTPVIAICGTDDRSNIFDIEIALRNQFIKKGYKVSQIGSKEYSDLFQCHPFPQFMFSTYLTENEKIYALNKYVKDMEDMENPDIILIGIKDGIEQLSEKFDGNFGITAYEVFKAIRPDYTILSTLFKDCDVEYFNLIQNSSYYKYGNIFDCFIMSNVFINYSRSEQYEKKIYSAVSLEQLDIKVRELTECELQIYNIFNENNVMLLTENILDNLENNACLGIY